MPIYEYWCTDCGEKFDKLVSFSSKEEIECPKCGSKKVQKTISSFATRASSASRTSVASCAPSGGG